ncbi:MAG: hypothetical protein WBI07_21635 [Mobilitalea sp.]
MKNFTVSKRDLKLLLILLSVIILYLSYQFIYTKNMAKVEVLDAEIVVLDSRLSELQTKENERENMVAENTAITQEIQDIIHSYGNGATEEKSIMMVKSIEDIADMEISTVSLSDPQYFFSGDQSTTIVEDQTMEGTDANADLLIDEAVAGADTTLEEAPLVEDINTDAGAQEFDFTALKGYRTTISISFRVSYDGLKKCLDYINNYSERSNVSDLNLSYDIETGMLSGSMNIYMYHIVGPSIQYQEPIIDTGEIGVENVFGTIELPAAGQ